ncbi:cytochrome b561 domain-containing protein 2 [Anoplophora glabripennis]|uniref:cytochrome b561 domain-containing protein 2 n=1 Tax=Anoplophora glabripennis TaxID=217634 RepID=UPI000874D3A2|nr:cytochrome b561 domain-containing protein 2 [Anoplophora glabripennis]
MSFDYGKLPINVARFLANYLTRFIFGGLLLYCCWTPLQNLSGWFSYHVILCTFGYIPLMAEALMLFVGDELWSRQLSRKQKYSVHAILITVGTVFIIVGNSLMFHYYHPDYHFYTAHGITGLISMIILILSLFLGVAANYSNEMKSYLSLRPVWYKFVHNGVGILGYAIGIVSLCYGYYTHWFAYYHGEESRAAALILTIVVSLWSINGAIASGYNQIKSLFS